jgi:hypothetical protein
MADCTAIKTQLDAANAAYSRLVTGGAARVVVDTDGSRIEYTAANRGSLYAYILTLQSQYNHCIGVHHRVGSRPVNFIF